MRSVRGFTLIELLVVIAILGSLSAMVLLNFNSQTDKARDVERKSDLKQYQAALEAYANRNNGLYPIQSASGVAVHTLCGTLGLSGCPQDPQAGAGHQNYLYRSDASGTRYVLWAIMKIGTPTSAFVVCSNGQTGNHPTSTLNVTSSANCPI